MIGKEALLVIMGLKRFKGDEEKMQGFVKKHVIRLLKSDKIAVLNELERQQEVDLALKVVIFSFCQPRVYVKFVFILNYEHCIGL